MSEKITVQSVSDIITSKAGNEYFTFEDMGQKRYVCYNPKLKEYCKVSSEIEADLTPGKTPEDSPRLDMVYVNGKPVIGIEKKTAGRSYGKSDKELLQIKQLAEAQNRSIQAQTSLNRAVDLAVAGINNKIEIETTYVAEHARKFYQLLQSLTQISEAQVIHKEVKDVSTKVSTEKAGRDTREGLGQGDREGGDFDEEGMKASLNRVGFTQKGITIWLNQMFGIVKTKDPMDMIRQLNEKQLEVLWTEIKSREKEKTE